MTDIVQIINVIDDVVIVKIADSSDDVVAVSVGDTGLKGRPGIVWRDSWSPTLDYYVGDVVTYNGSSFICVSFISANASAYPPATASNWTMFVEKGRQGGVSVTVGSVAPVGACLIGSYENETDCIAGGSSWESSGVGDLWFNTAIGRLYTQVADSEGDLTWFDMVGSMDASDIVVASSGELPAGSLQDVLKHLEDQVFTSATTPTGSTTEEGDLWYDTSTDQMKFLRNGVWEVIVQKGAISDPEGYEALNLNGGYF